MQQTYLISIENEENIYQEVTEYQIYINGFKKMSTQCQETAIAQFARYKEEGYQVEIRQVKLIPIEHKIKQLEERINNLEGKYLKNNQHSEQIEDIREKLSDLAHQQWSGWEADKVLNLEISKGITIRDAIEFYLNKTSSESNDE